MTTMEIAKRKLEEIEYRNYTWKSKVIRDLAIWQEIAMHVNSYPSDSDKGKLWCLVMELYREKYK